MDNEDGTAQIVQTTLAMVTISFPRSRLAPLDERLCLFHPSGSPGQVSQQASLPYSFGPVVSV